MKLNPEKTKLVFGKRMLPDHSPVVSYSGMSFFLDASIKIGYFLGGMPSEDAIKSSKAKGFSERNITPVFLGLPFEGPLPSWAMRPSTIFKVGLTTEQISTISLAKLLLFRALKCQEPFSFPGTQPKVFFTANVRIVSE